MPRFALPPRRRLAIAGLIAALIVGACGAAATPVPTPTPTPAPTPSPSPSPSPDPAAGLKIGSPYTITALDPVTEAALQTEMKAGLGALSSVLSVGGRQVSKGGTLAAQVIVMAFPGTPLSAEMYKGAVGGIASSSKVKFTTKKVSGVELSTGSAASGGIGVFRLGDQIVIVTAASKATVLTIATALIKANH